VADKNTRGDAWVQARVVPLLADTPDVELAPTWEADIGGEDVDTGRGGSQVESVPIVDVSIVSDVEWLWG